MVKIMLSKFLLMSVCFGVSFSAVAQDTVPQKIFEQTASSVENDELFEEENVSIDNLMRVNEELGNPINPNLLALEISVANNKKEWFKLEEERKMALWSFLFDELGKTKDQKNHTYSEDRGQVKDRDGMHNLLKSVAAARTVQQKDSAPTQFSNINAGMPDYISTEITKNWNVDAGVKNAEKINIELKVYLDKGGTVTKVDNLYKGSDPAIKRMAESAVRAVWICDKKEDSPFKRLATEYKGSYSDWREIHLFMNPLGGVQF